MIVRNLCNSIVCIRIIQNTCKKLISTKIYQVELKFIFSEYLANKRIAIALTITSITNSFKMSARVLSLVKYHELLKVKCRIEK